MNTLVVYDLLYGNTQEVAKTIHKTLSSIYKSKIIKIDSKLLDLKSIDILVIGTPTHGGQPTESIQNFVNQIPQNSLSHLKFAAFDTGFRKQDHPFFLKALINLIGYASPKISQVLIKKGASQLVPPKTFYVNDKQGPLLKNQINQAKSYSKQILSEIS